MKGWIIYSQEDVEKNRFYIQMYVEKFKEVDVDIETIIVQQIIDINNLIEEGKPYFAINRSRYAEIGKELENRGIKVFNSSKVTEIANDKAESFAFLKDIVPFMPVKYEDREIVSGIAERGFTYPLVVKSCNGHGGEQVFMVENDSEFNDTVRLMNGQKFLVQESSSDLGRDVRVYIIGNKVVASMLRTSTKSFKSNYSLGGKAEVYQLNDEEMQMVTAITDKLPMDFAGIDFIFHNGKAVFNEIEDAVGARMLYNVAGIDIVQLFVDYIVEILGIS